MIGRYAIEIFYNEEDEGYIAKAPELPGCSAFGETEEEALKEIKASRLKSILTNLYQSRLSLY